MTPRAAAGRGVSGPLITIILYGYEIFNRALARPPKKMLKSGLEALQAWGCEAWADLAGAHHADTGHPSRIRKH